MRSDRGLAAWFDQLHRDVTVCGQLHPDLHVACVKRLGHTTLGRTAHDRAHVWAPGNVTGRQVTWTVIADHKWRIDQKRRGRHPAGGDEPR